ncbi:hypothetical protein SCUP515_09217 [Seiridium cupressi]
MRVSIILAALPLLASASPLGHADLEERGNSFCKVNAFIISALKIEAGASSYCMSHLSMGTKTITSTATVTPSRIYTNRSMTVTASAQITTGVTTLTRFTNATTIGTVFSDLMPDRNPNRDEFHRIDSDLLRSTCFAQETRTVNIVSTISLKPVITSVLTSTKTSNRIENSTTTIFSTVTQTATATATQLSPNGLKFGTFTHAFNNDDTVDEADPSYFKGKTPEHSGVIEDLNFSSGQSSQINIGGQVIPSAFQAVLAQGYFLARTVGTYTFTTSGDIVDNWVFLWHGNAAYSNWDKNNTDYESFGGRPEPNVDGSLTLTLDAGDAVPITFLWLNGAGQGTSNLYITTPEGQTFTNTTGWFIQACSNSTFS